MFPIGLLPMQTGPQIDRGVNLAAIISGRAIGFDAFNIFKDREPRISELSGGNAAISALKPLDALNVFGPNTQRREKTDRDLRNQL